MSRQQKPARRARSTGYYQRQRRRARQRDSYRCRVCGSTRNLEVYHLNHDPTDHALSNLLTLCRHCHHHSHGHNRPSEKPRLLFSRNKLIYDGEVQANARKAADSQP